MEVLDMEWKSNAAILSVIFSGAILISSTVYSDYYCPCYQPSPYSYSYDDPNQYQYQYSNPDSYSNYDQESQYQNHPYAPQENQDYSQNNQNYPQNDTYALRQYARELQQNHVVYKDPRDRDIHHRNNRIGNWGYRQNYRYDREAFYSGKTQAEAYDLEHPEGAGGIGRTPDYDYLRIRRLYETEANADREHHYRQQRSTPNRVSIRAQRSNSQDQGEK